MLHAGTDVDLQRAVLIERMGAYDKRWAAPRCEMAVRRRFLSAGGLPSELAAIRGWNDWVTGKAAARGQDRPHYRAAEVGPSESARRIRNRHANGVAAAKPARKRPQPSS